MDASGSKPRRWPRSRAPRPLAELDEARVRYLGRKSELKQALREVRDRETGMLLNGSATRSRQPSPSGGTPSSAPSSTGR